MRKLTIRNFSAIEHAEIDVRPITIIIGPQASGKSLISKLLHFMTKTMDPRSFSRTEDRDPRDVKKRILEEFEKNFPRPAWGSREFQITMQSGDFTAEIIRRRKSNGSYHIKIEMSENLSQLYSTFVRALKQVTHPTDNDHRDLLFVRTQEVNWKIRDEFTSVLQAYFGKDFVTSQHFIPAGRSFFTSLGKTVTAFDHSESLDPFVRQFGRFYSSIKEFGIRRTGKTNSPLNRFYAQMSEMLGGRVVLKENAEYVETNDGRQIPFQILSSGQQELLPLWLIFAFLLTYEAGRDEGRIVIAIEEPEAHLFPESQAKVIEILAGTLSRMSGMADLIITTHSPYVLAKTNNLIRAAEIGVGATEELRKKLMAIVPSAAWLPLENVAAYAIESGRTSNIVVDGYIEADYIDRISESISEEFYQLIGLHE